MAKVEKSEVGINAIYERDLTFYKDFINHLKIPILLVDENGKIIYANHATSLVTGYSDSELLSMHFNDLFETEYTNIFDKIKEMENIEGRIKVKHQESPRIAANIKMYGFRPNNRRHHYYQIILKDFYADHDLNHLKRPLLSLTEQLQKMNDALEQHAKELLRHAGLNTKHSK